MEQSNKTQSGKSNIQKYLSTFLKFLLFLGVGLTILFLVFNNQSEKYVVKCVLDQVDSSGCVVDSVKLEAIRNNLGLVECDLKSNLLDCFQNAEFRAKTNITEEEISCLNNNANPEACDLLTKVINDFASANYFWLFMMIFVYMVSNVSRAIRWIMLIKPMGYNPSFLNAFCAVMLNYFANLGLPRVGEFVRAGTLAKYENIPMEKLMGTVVTDRIMDVICLAIVMATAFFLEFDTLWSFTVENMGEPDALISKLVILGLVGLGFLALLFLFRKKIQELNFFKKILSILQGFWEGIQTIRNLDKPGLFIFHSINIWVMYFLMVYFGTFSFEPVYELGMQGSTVIFAGGSLGMVIPAPGGMGSYQFIVTEILDKVYGIASDEGFSFSNILFFTIQIGGNVIFGLLALLALPIINRGK